MGLFGNDQEKADVAAEHKWDYFNLSDFKSTSCWSPFSYAILYISLAISIAVYVVDIFTCSQLLLFDHWSGQIQPKVPFEISRWVFTACILLSLVLLVWRWFKALRAIRSGGVANSFLDPLAVRVQSIRMGQRGRGWRRFLVFAALTKGRKGAEYVALFTYFSFEASLRILLAEGPRQAINAMTLASVMQSDIIPSGAHAAAAGHSPIIQFFINVGILAQGNKTRAVVLFGMLFTLIIWIISAFGLALACIFYITFLWHHIPTDDRGLSGFCKRKVDGRLQKIVDEKVKKAMEKEDKKRLREEAKAAKSADSIRSFKRQPTVPILSDDKLPEMPLISRQNTTTTLPEYSSRPPTSQGDPMPNLQRQPTFPNSDGGFSRPLPSRTATQASAQSYASSNAPLLGSAASMGYDQPGRPYSPGQTSPIDPYGAPRQPLGRSLTGQSQASQRSYGSQPYQMRPGGPSRQNTNGFPPGSNRIFTAPPRSNTGFSEGQFTPSLPIRSNTAMSDPRFIPGPPRRQNTGGSNMSDGNYFGGPNRPPQSQSPVAQGSFGPSYEMQPQRPLNNVAAQGNKYVAFNPLGRPDMPQRSDTAPPISVPYDDSIYDSYRDSGLPRPQVPIRSATAGPGVQQWQHGL